MKMILSRHGRIDYNSWADRDVNDIRQALEDLVEVVRLENEAAVKAAEK